MSFHSLKFIWCLIVSDSLHEVESSIAEMVPKRVIFVLGCFVCRLNALNKGVGLSDGLPHPVDPADDPVLFVNNFVTKA